jgi:hypothetical protein
MVTHKIWCFTVDSMHMALKICAVKWPHRNFWFVKFPLKIKVFIWLAFRKSILTKYVLIRSGWKGEDSKCCFCDDLKTIDHLVLECKLSRYAWGVVKCATYSVDVPMHFLDI